MGHLFFLMISYILALFFLTLGLLCAVIPWSDGMRALVLDFLQHNWVMLFLFGVGCLVVGMTILLNLSMSSRRRHYTVRTGPYLVAVDKDLVTSYLQAYFQGRYPKREIPCNVTIKSDRLQIAADLPTTPLEEQKSLLKKIENDLQELLAARLGYYRPLRLYISFGD
jgi:hypothetical protein